MNTLLAGYESSSSSTNEASPHSASPDASNPTSSQFNLTKKVSRHYVQAAPLPSVLASVKKHHALDVQHRQLTLPSKSTKQDSNEMVLLMNNPTKADLLQPIQGPAITDHHPKASSSAMKKIMFDPTSFEEQRTAFQRTGEALAPDEYGTTVQRGNYGHTRRVWNAHAKRYEFISEDEFRIRKQKERSEWQQQYDAHYDNDPKDDYDEEDPSSGPTKDGSSTNLNTESTISTSSSRKRTRLESQSHQDPLVHDSDDEINYGIWGPPTKEMKDQQTDNMTDLQRAGWLISSLPEEIQAERAALAERDRQKGIEEEQRENQDFDSMLERKMAHLLPPKIVGEDAKAMEPQTIFHARDDEINYKGESWVVPPVELRDYAQFGDEEHHACFVPKKCVARLTGHNKGVHRIRLSPGTGHLLLSGGLDGKCKVWSVLHKKVMRTYIGHSAAVRDVQFNKDGSKFLSCSFDRFIRLWNTETGAVEGTYTNRRVPYVVQFYPKDNSIFVAGCSDNKIVAYDCNTGDIVQEYNHHLAPVNTITFVEDHGIKMITSSDDKKILIWEWDIGVPIKYISDPTMHSVPAITLHPSLSFFAGQSLDNKIVVYQAHDRFAMQKKKSFRGHQVSGYACDIAISPDGRYLCSGDGNGKLFFWDWKRGHILQKYHAHDKGPAVGCVWHPTQPSTVFTCGWDGVIKMWQ